MAGACNQYAVLEFGTDTASRAEQRTRSAASGTIDTEATQDITAGISAALQFMAGLVGQQGASPAASGTGGATSGNVDQKLDAIVDMLKQLLGKDPEEQAGE